jgi:hypothetical protein
MEVIFRSQFVDVAGHVVTPGKSPLCPELGLLGASSSSGVRLPQANDEAAIARNKTDSMRPLRHFGIARSFPSMLLAGRIVQRSSTDDGL